MAKKPFFMRFVEETPNATEPVRTDVTAGADGEGGPRKGREKGFECMKYPSDDDEPVWGDW